MAIKDPQISIIAPLYNEEEILPKLIERLDALIESSPLSIEVVLINDGSKDKTPQMITSLAKTNEHYTAVLLSRNFGHQKAVTAGMSVARCTEAAFIIDGDLQDPPELLDSFYTYIQDGYDVVYAVRQKRKENIFKKGAYFMFYRLLKMIANIDLPIDSGDFCLMSKRVLDLMNSMPEESRYLRGMRSWLGFKQIGVPYERDKRAGGESKYSLKMLFGLAYNGIFNFSEFPIKFITRIGAFGILISIMYVMYYLISTSLLDKSPPAGFTSILFFILFFGSLNLVCLGIIGEYLVRVFFEVKNRPVFIIDQVIRKDA